jgi:hypothetical protein
MSDVLTAEKPGSSKTVLASAMVVLLLAAFGVSFYYLDGVGYVSGLVASLLAQPKPSAPAVVPSGSKAATSSPLNLPRGVDEAFAKRMYVEQLESETNIQKLVGGQVSGFSMGVGTTVTGGREVPIRATFKDGTSGAGVLGLSQRQGDWYFVFISGRRTVKTGGQADSVANDPQEGFASNSDASLAKKTVDKDVLNTILSEQAKNQEVLSALAAGAFTDVKVDGVQPGQGTATLNITLTGPKTASMKGRILCINKSIDGTDTWFVTSFSKS